MPESVEVVTYYTTAPMGLLGCWASPVGDCCSREILDPQGESNLPIIAVRVEMAGVGDFRDGLRDRGFIVMNVQQWGELIKAGFGREDWWEADTMATPVGKSLGGPKRKKKKSRNR